MSTLGCFRMISLAGPCLLLLGCGDTSPANNQGSSYRGYSPPQKEPEDVGPSTAASPQLVFSHPDDEKLLRRWETIARRLAGPDWDYERCDELPISRSYRAWWSSVSGSNDRSLPIHPSRRPVGREYHSIVLFASRDAPKTHEVSGVGFEAKWYPAETGWGASVLCSTIRGDSQRKDPKSWTIYFQPANRTRGPFISYYPRFAFYTASHDFGGTSYRLFVKSEPFDDTYQKGVDNATLRRWIATPESLRDTGLAWLKGLREKVESDVMADEAEGYLVESNSHVPEDQFFTVSFPQRFSGLRGDLGQKGARTIAAFLPAPEPGSERKPRRPSDRKMTDAEKKLVIQKADDAIARRRQLLEDHHREMHAALLKAFPVLELLDE